jgi:hypothetical protein
VQKLEQEDRPRELNADAIIGGAFGCPFQEECAGVLGQMYETAGVRDGMIVFVDTKLTRMDDAAKIRIKERIANLDGKRKVVQAVDAVVRLYKTLEIAGVFVEQAEKKAVLLQAIG